MMKDSDSCLANPNYTQWILEAIRKIRKQKQRPNEERICHAVRHGRGLDQTDIKEQLELCVRDGNVLKVMNKGVASYRDPEFSPGTRGGGRRASRGTSTAKILGNLTLSTDYLRLILCTIKQLAEGGSTLKSVEKYIRQSYNVDTRMENDLSSKLRLAAKKGIAQAKLTKDGKLFRLPDQNDKLNKLQGDNTKNNVRVSKGNFHFIFNIQLLNSHVEKMLQVLQTFPQ
ncbi:histone acetyltransferase KAT6B-like [Lytechinus variegatus]|uniref:histone acetyltransferase KAT6B-like n=1 Tax=Lytechinus variegatus TaxID=7654 RepID=UPI001BB15AC4|nr:histone acetyltransferase KAT6B-like [Lytechinus variegatus]XP_041485709.1 histone acetyltransferase KAT6B-like [Lytechinus variegatus]